jgi:uncharacterized protein (TIGR03437 family)
LTSTGIYLVEITSDSGFSGLSYSLLLSKTAEGCDYSVPTAPQQFEATGGTGNITLNTGGDCRWTSSSSVDWIRLATGSLSGQGNAQISYTVLANTTNTTRSGVITIANRSITVEQAGTGGSCAIRAVASGQAVSGSFTQGDCRVSNLPVDRYSFNGLPGERVAIVLTPSNAQSFERFTIRLYSPDGALLSQSQTGRLPSNAGSLILPKVGNYLIEVTTNSLSAASTNYTLTLNQQAACTYSVSPLLLIAPAGGGTASFNVRTAAGCDWLVQSNSDWITVGAAGSFGAGNAAAQFTAERNTTVEQRIGSLTIAGQNVSVFQAGLATVVSSASFKGPEIAPDSLATVYGGSLATETKLSPVPVDTLAGTTITINDSAGNSSLGLLYFVSPGQVNFLVPATTAIGPATVTIGSGDGKFASGEVQIVRVAPGLLTANSDGRGVAAAQILRIKAGGSRTYEPVFKYDEDQKRFVVVPIDLGSEGDQVYFVGFGTGWRGRSSLDEVKLQIGGIDATVGYAGAQPESPGLDQINALIPRSLIGKGEVDVILTVDGRIASTVIIAVK